MHGVLEEHEAWLACADDGAPLGLMVLEGDWVGLGTRFIKLAKQRRPRGLQLWTFQSNVRAPRFYKRNGFTVEERTDGAGLRSGHPICDTSGDLPRVRPSTTPPDRPVFLRVCHVLAACMLTWAHDGTGWPAWR
jgi:hypothetical protein